MKIFRRILLVIALIALSGGIFAYVSYKRPVRGVSVAQKVDYCVFSKQDMLDEINQFRSHKLVEENYLDELAQKRADSMPFELDHHVGFEKLGDQGYFDKYLHAGEILASNHCASTFNLFTQWKYSEGHWKLITNEDFDTFGIGFNGQSAVVIFGDL